MSTEDIEEISQVIDLLEEHVEERSNSNLEQNLLKRVRGIDTQIKNIDSTIRDLQEKRKGLIGLRDSIRSQILEDKAANLLKKNWDSNEFEWSINLKDKLNDIFKISDYRPHQLPSMNATLSGTDCILIMPTGGGKSLCYQLPALVSKGITLVVSPLISLMEDQLMGLNRLGIIAKKLSASSTKEDVLWVQNAMLDPKSELKLIYVTPEKLAKSKRFMSKLQKMHQLGRFARLAIDEVHCCSQWGHDFRPDYKYLGIMRQMFPGTPIIGLTATATSRVIQDVQKILNIQGCLVLKASFNRPNLFYEVRAKPSAQKECIDQLVKLLQGSFKGQSGIIYTMTIKETEQLAKDLRSEGISIAPYHSELPPESRLKIHKKWIENYYQVVVATIAFGMGIDKPDVRFVIHHCISKSMENFYQESGRAGRDNKPSKCILFWRFGDLCRQSTMVFTEQTGLDNLYGIIGYCLDSNRCRRNIIADHFDERWESSDCDEMCDHCCRSIVVKSKDLIREGKQLVKLIKNASTLDVRLTGLKLIDAWMGKGATNLRLKDCTTDLNRERVESVVAHLLVDGYLREDFHYTAYSTISYIVPGYKSESDIDPSPMNIGISSQRKEKTQLKVPVKKGAIDSTKTGSNRSISKKRKISESSIDSESSFDEKSFQNVRMKSENGRSSNNKMEKSEKENGSVRKREKESSSMSIIVVNSDSEIKPRKRIVTIDSSDSD